MQSRGILSNRYGYGYGRDRIAGSVVFPCINGRGECVFLMKKIIGGRYYGDGRVPQLDHTGRDSRTSLILVEGAIDALMIRQRYNLWSSPTYGVCPSPFYLSSIKRAHLMGRVDKVWVLFDSEGKAEVESNNVADTLNYVYGVPSSPIHWKKITGEDPASCKYESLDRILAETVFGST